MKTIIPVTSTNQIETTARLANEIWTEHYTPIIGSGQVEYMLEKFQSVTAIVDQIDSGTLYFMIMFEDEPTGYISVYKKNTSLFLSKFYVHKSMRGKGLGKMALAFIEDKARELNCESISLTVNKHNTNSIKAYDKLGFTNRGPIVIDIGNGYIMDDFAFEKILTSKKD